MSIARNSLAYWISQVTDIGLRFVTMVFTAVILGPERRGLIFAVLLAGNLLLSLTNLGLQPIAMYFAGKERDQIARLHTLILWLIGVIVAGDALMVYLFGDWLRVHVFDSIDGRFFFCVLLILPFSLYAFAAQGLLTGLGRIPIIARILFYYSVASSAVNLAALSAFEGHKDALVVALLVLWMAAECLRALVFAYFVLKIPCGLVLLSFGELIAGLRRLLSYGLRVFVGNFAAVLVNKLDQIIIMQSMGKIGLGIYGVSVRLAELVFYSSAAFESAGYARVAASEQGESARLIQDLFRANFLINFVAMLGLLVAGPFFISIVLGYEYRAAILPLLILLPGTLCFSTSRMMALYFSAQLGKPQVPSLVGWISALFYGPMLYWIVIRRGQGLIGAAWVSTLCYALVLAILMVFFMLQTGLHQPAPYFIPQRRDWIRLRRLLGKES